MTSIPVSFRTSGSDLFTSHKLSKVSPGQAKRLNRKLLRKNSGAVESGAGGWVGDIIPLESVQKTLSVKKPPYIGRDSALAAKGTASQVSQTQRWHRLQLLRTFLPSSPRSRGSNPAGLPKLRAGWLRVSPAAPPCSSHRRGHALLHPPGKPPQAVLLTGSMQSTLQLGRRKIKHTWLGEKTHYFGRVLIQKNGNSEKPRNVHVKIPLVLPTLLPSSLVFRVTGCLLLPGASPQLRHESLGSATRKSVTPLMSLQKALPAIRRFSSRSGRILLP